MNARPNLEDQPEPIENTLVKVNFDNLEAGKYYFVYSRGFWHLMKVNNIEDDKIKFSHLESFDDEDGWGIPHAYFNEDDDEIPKARFEDGSYHFYRPMDVEGENENEAQAQQEPEIPPPAPNPEGAANVEMEGNEIHGGARRRTRRMNRKRRSTRRRHSRRRCGRRAATRRHRK